MKLFNTTTALTAIALAAPLALGAAAQAQTYQIGMPLGGTSGTFYVQGAALADHINSRASGIRIVPSTSGGSVENIRLVGSGQAEFGMAFEGHIFGAWTGDGFERAYNEYRMIGPAQQTSGWNYVTLANSGIDSVQDLIGRQFVPGAPGSGSASDADLFLEHIGIRDQIDISYYSWGELGRMLSDGDIDAFNRTGGAPAPFAQEIDATHPLKVIDLEAEIDESGFLEAYPFFTKFTIEAGTYSGQEEDAVTYAQGVQWIVHMDVPDEAVREFLELAFTDEAADHLDRAFPNHDHRNMEWLNEAYVPLHPAAAEFWAEKGLEIPDPIQE